jgi:hypothetical protein
MTPRLCAACGTSLAGRRRDAKFCGGACRAKASRKRRLEDAEPLAWFWSGVPPERQSNRTETHVSPEARR